jgi:hypothetical protein
MKLFLTVGLVLFTTALLHAQIELSLHLQAGKTYSLSATEKTTIIETPYGVDVKTVTNTTASFNFKFLKKQDTAYLMEVRFNSISKHVEGPQGITYQGSEPTDTGAVSKLLSKVMDKPFRVVMDKNYNWREVIGLEDIFREALACCLGSQEASRKIDSLLAADMKYFITEGSNPLVQTRPPAHLRPGEVWAVHTVSDRGVPTNDSCSYLVEAYGDDLVVKGSGTSNSVEKETLSDGKLVSFFLSGGIDYTARFDKQSRWIKHANITTTLKGHAISKREGGIFKQKIPMTVTTESIVNGY